MKYLFVILTSVTFFAACKSKKPLVKEERRTFDSLQFPTDIGRKDSLLRKPWNHFSSRMAVDYSDGEQDLSGTISLRMRRDSIIWFSVSASIGIQVAKGIVTKDSVKILDLYNKKYTRYSIKKLGEMFGAEIGLRELQNLIIGNPVFDTLVYQKEMISKSWFGTQAPLSNAIFCSDFSLPDSSYITQSGSKRQVKATYTGSQSAGGFSIAEKMMFLAIGDAKNVRMDIEFTTASDAVIPSYPFVVPEGYEIEE